MTETEEDLLEFEEDTQKDKYLTFGLGKDEFGIEIKYVREIIGIQPISEVPEVPDFIRGIINLRGKIIPVMDVRTRFKKEVIAYNDRTCIIVVDIHDNSMGLIVDKVLEVLSIAEAEIVPPPEYRAGTQNKYIKSIGKSADGVKLILDCEKLLEADELEFVENISV